MVPALGPAWSAAHGGGVHGVLRVDGKDCWVRGPCRRIGTFVSDDGATTLTDARLRVINPFGGESVGTRLRTTWQGERDPAQVYREKGSKDWIYVIVFLSIGILAALWCLLCAIEGCLRFRERRKPPHPLGPSRTNSPRGRTVSRCHSDGSL